MPKTINKRSAPTGARGSRRGSPSINKEPYKHSLLIDPNGIFIDKETDLKNVEIILGKLSRRLTIKNVVYENGQFRPHIHATIESSRKTLFAKKYQYKGFYVGIMPMRSAMAYKKYLMKEKKEEYLFSDTE